MKDNSPHFVCQVQGNGMNLEHYVTTDVSQTVNHVTVKYGTFDEFKYKPMRIITKENVPDGRIVQVNLFTPAYRLKRLKNRRS